MKGKLILTDISSPVEGMQVVHRGHIYQLLKDNKTGSNGSWWTCQEVGGKVQGYETNIHTSNMVQIVVEYEEEEKLDPKEITSKFFPSKIRKTLPLHPDDWKEAINRIGEKVEFEQSEDSTIHHRIAKLIHPTPVTYTEEEVKKLIRTAIMDSKLIKGWKKEYEEKLTYWWNEHKKK